MSVGRIPKSFFAPWVFKFPLDELRKNLFITEIRVDRRRRSTKVVKLIERLCSEEGLECKIKGTIKSYPGSIHWHFTSRQSRGTLEVTFWPQGSTIWVSVHANREGLWTREALERLTMNIENKLV